MSTHDEHSSFIKTPQQLVVVILLAFVVPIFGIVMLVQLVVNRPSADPGAMTPEAVSARLQPVGRVEFGPPGTGVVAAGSGSTPVAAAPGAAAKPAAAGPASGKKIYDSVCFACHATGVANAPKLGDKAAWAPRIATGLDAMVGIALKGKGAMPPKGGNAGLSDADLRAAVEFMVSQSK